MVDSIYPGAPCLQDEYLISYVIMYVNINHHYISFKNMICDLHLCNMNLFHHKISFLIDNLHDIVYDLHRNHEGIQEIIHGVHDQIGDGNMPKSIMEMVQELVLSQSEQRIMSADELDQLIVCIYKSFKKIQAMEIGGVVTENMNNSLAVQDQPLAEPADVKEEQLVTTPIMEPSESIRDDVIVCLECGKEMRQLTHTHLRNEHGLSSEEYKEKYGFPKNQPLSARSVSEARKDRAREAGTGERLKRVREAKRASKERG